MSSSPVLYAAVGIAGFSFMEFVGGPALGLGTDLRVSFGKEAKAMAAFGKLTADLSCAEQAAVSKKIADYFAGKAKDGAKNPDFTITKEECEALVTARTARSATPVAKP